MCGSTARPQLRHQPLRLRVARRQEGALFTDWYGQQSCTAGRAAFITGHSPIRTGLTKVGLPGAPEGMKKEDPTIATLLKAQGYVTGQFGKNQSDDGNPGPAHQRRTDPLRHQARLGRTLIFGTAAALPGGCEIRVLPPRDLVISHQHTP